MKFVLAIDGGGSGCRAALADGSGRVLARAEGGPANIASDGVGAVRNLLAVSRDVLQGVDAADVHVVMGLAGANVAGSVAAVQTGFALPFASVRIETDARIAVVGALGGMDGIVVVLGTGSVFSCQRGGQMRQVGGHGLILGDEAGGAWLGRGLLSAAARAADGMGAMTPMLAAALEEVRGLEGVIAFSLTARPADFARFAPRLIGSDDPAAVALLAQAEKYISASVLVLQAGEALPVVFLGSLGLALAHRFAGRWLVRPALGSGLDGALWLGLQDAAAR
jgi:glucosamine kinase